MIRRGAIGMRFGFLVFDDLEELDLLGPWELIGVWAECEHGPSERLLIGENPGGIRCAKGIGSVDVSFESAPSAVLRQDEA